VHSSVSASNTKHNSKMSDDGDEERVTAQSYGALDATNVEDECWMIRLPQKLAEIWENAPEGTVLGDLVFTKGGSTQQGGRKATVKPSLMVHVSESLEQEVSTAVAAAQAETEGTGTASTGSSAARGPKQPSALPLHYSLQAMTKRVPTMVPFTRNAQNGKVKLWGTVSRTANLQVEQDSNYRALLKDRLVATSITTSRFVKPVEGTESVMSKRSNASATAMNMNSKTFGNAVFQYGKRKLEAAESSGLAQQQGLSKKVRQFAPDQPLKSVVFELFSQQQYWTVKDLKAAAVAGGATDAGTKRGEAEIREVLREIGDYHRSGDHKNMWELRTEFQQQS
jgi:hypothetical protein